jgi:hypothetical protein
VRRLLLASLPLFIALPARAQIIRRGSLGEAPPAAWVSLGAAVENGWTVNDAGTRWQFGTATQYQASIEKAFSGVSLGLRGSTANAPLRYTRAPSADLGSGPSGIDEDADARVSQLFVAAHVAGTRGFHTVLELDAGATLYSGFRSRATGQALPPSSDADFTFAFGYGAGYGFSNRFQVEIVQDVTQVLHQRTGLSAGDDSSARMTSTRIVGRFGLGQRR